MRKEYEEWNWNSSYKCVMLLNNKNIKNKEGKGKDSAGLDLS